MLLLCVLLLGLMRLLCFVVVDGVESFATLNYVGVVVCCCVLLCVIIIRYTTVVFYDMCRMF